ncbi:hypothetical protein CHS0354_038456 [Potamilus streckersoni]|uniref:Mitochondrial inner membrane protease subunit 2 n=1 Tax=Potamilus streckersoni TaxID=2493646 RepID=A0AAE0S673_9BIVA|nr:hypothetical protein CHS0354_038456 [Potamilus streckersoni]
MMWRKVLAGTVTLAIPVTITALDLFGYVAKVEGASMQPVLNPDTERRDYVYLNKWAAHGYHFKRGEIVSLLSSKFCLCSDNVSEILTFVNPSMIPSAFMML